MATHWDKFFRGVDEILWPIFVHSVLRRNSRRFFMTQSAFVKLIAPVCAGGLSTSELALVWAAEAQATKVFSFAAFKRSICIVAYRIAPRDARSPTASFVWFLERLVAHATQRGLCHVPAPFDRAACAPLIASFTPALVDLHAFYAADGRGVSVAGWTNFINDFSLELSSFDVTAIFVDSRRVVDDNACLATDEFVEAVCRAAVSLASPAKCVSDRLLAGFTLMRSALLMPAPPQHDTDYHKFLKSATRFAKRVDEFLDHPPPRS